MRSIRQEFYAFHIPRSHGSRMAIRAEIDTTRMGQFERVKRAHDNIPGSIETDGNLPCRRGLPILSPNFAGERGTSVP